MHCSSLQSLLHTQGGAFLADVLPFRMPRLRATMADTEPYYSPVCSRCRLQDHSTQMVGCRNLEMVNQPHQWVKEQPMVCYYLTCLDWWFVEIR